MNRPYRGRIAPSPTGYLHLGHARTFWTARSRARQNDGVLVLRNEDLDAGRCKEEFVAAMIDDLRWFGFEWQEGPDCGGPFGPYNQSERRSLYLSAFEELRARNLLYPCTCSRQDVMRALSAPHDGDEEPVYPGTCRPSSEHPGRPSATSATTASTAGASAARISWRFRVPDGEAVSFVDGYLGPQEFVAGADLGDFVLWRHDDVSSYQLAVVVDDAAMGITEVVRGDDLLVSAARQILLYRALGLPAPDFYHCPLIRDEKGARLAKRHDSLSLRKLRAEGASPEELRSDWD